MKSTRQVLRSVCNGALGFFDRRPRRRSRGSAPAPVPAEVLEARQLMSATNGETSTLPSIRILDSTVVEGETAGFVVELSHASAVQVSVQYVTREHTATAADFTQQSGTLIFNPGETRKTIRVETIDDNFVEPTEILAVDLFAVQNAVYADAVGVAHIEDNEVAKPIVIGPIGTIEDARPAFQWEPVAGAASYRIWVNDVTNRISGILRTNNITGTSFTPNLPLADGDYAWEVRAMNADGESSQWSQRVLFTVDSGVPGTPVLIGPIDTEAAALPTFEWEAVAGAASYRIWVNDHTNRLSGIIRNRDIVGTSFTPDVPLTDGEFTWEVQAINADGEVGRWSQRKSFTVEAGVPSRPILTGPVGTSSDTTPTFQWQAVPGATSYRIWVNDRTNRLSGIIRDRNIVTNSFTPDVPLTDGEFTWEVQAISANGEISQWSQRMSFTIEAGIPNRPILQGPIGETSDGTPTFRWESVTGATAYRIWVSDRTHRISGIIRDRDITDTSFTPSVSLADGEYVWEVQALNANGEVSPWSQRVSFVIASGIASPLISS